MYTGDSGISGENILVMKITDAAVIADLMMGGSGADNHSTELSEIQLSAVSEAMNQMIGSAATSMATMFNRRINISPPDSRIWNDSTESLAKDIKEDEDVVLVSFKLTIGKLVDSSIMQVLPLSTAKNIVSIMMGKETPSEEKEEPAAAEPVKDVPAAVIEKNSEEQQKTPKTEPQTERVPESKVEVHQAAFKPLAANQHQGGNPKNLDLILDVPLEISVVLGRTKKSIKDVLNLGTGSLVELDKLAEEPVEILVNGKKVAYGEVVVVDENFGVRITSIVSNSDRIKSLSK